MPLALSNIETSGSLADASKIKNSITLMQSLVRDKQLILESIYRKVFQHWHTDIDLEGLTILPFNPFPVEEVPDQKVWDVLSSKEQRSWIKANTNIKLDDTASNNTGS